PRRTGEAQRGDQVTLRRVLRSVRQLSEGAFAPLPKLPPGFDRAGFARARSRPLRSRRLVKDGMCGSFDRLLFRAVRALSHLEWAHPALCRGHLQRAHRIGTAGAPRSRPAKSSLPAVLTVAGALTLISTQGAVAEDKAADLLQFRQLSLELANDI